MTLTSQWRDRVRDTLSNGVLVSPRGMKTLEVPQGTISFDMNQPVLMQPSRQLNYQFMLAEAWWILAGKDDVASIAKYNRHISKFSDDGVTFAGAYGPKIRDQLDYVVTTLMGDPDSRQAGLTLWVPNPGKSKDIPCTIAMWFQLRKEDDELRLNMSVFMRSSDVWLGLPYDSFNFTMVAATVCAMLNQNELFSGGGTIQMGMMHLTAASSHLYERDWAPAETVMTQDRSSDGDAQMLPRIFYSGETLPVDLLDDLKDTKKDDPARWWHAA